MVPASSPPAQKAKARRVFPPQKKTPALVGIDVGTTAIKVLQLSRHADRLRVDHYAIEPLQPGLVRDKTITSNEPVAQAIERALRRAGVKVKGAAVAVSGSGVTTKVISIPGSLQGLSEDDLQSQVELEAANHIPFPLDEVRMDYDVLGAAKADGMLEVLVAVARNEAVMPLQEAVEMAGLTVEIMDVESLAMESAYRTVAQDRQVGSEERVALVNIGAESVGLTVFQNGQPLYSREQAFNTQDLEKNTRQRGGLSQEEALAQLRNGTHPEGFEEEVIAPFRENLVQSVGRLLQYFYSNTEQHATVQRVLLTGGGARTPGLEAALDDHLGIPAQVVNPLSAMSVGPGVNGRDLTADAPLLFLVTGLALRSVA